MSIADELRAELRDAMRARDRDRTDVIRNVEAEVGRAKTAPGFSGEADDELYASVMASYVKRMEKAREEFLAAGEKGRAQADKLAFEVGYLGRWLPDSLDEDETRALVRSAIAELKADDPKQAGRVVGHVMKSGVEGLDGALVSRLVREELAAG